VDNSLRPALAELIGTFALVFVGAGAAAVQVGGLPGVALAHGLILVAIVYSLGHVSGAHVNPAVTIGLLAGGDIAPLKAAWYIIAQLMGGILAAAALRLIVSPATGLGTTQLGSAMGTSITPAQGTLVEIVLTFLLVTTVLNTAVRGHAGKMAGLAIGFTLAACILMGGPLTGASLNPARSLGPALLSGQWNNHWVYWLGPIIGGMLASVLSRAMVPPPTQE
jgi:MIP family channel proteins